MNKDVSPFRYRRWETDDLHLIWLPPKFNEWEKKRCVYFTGARGSGKTTLLRGFEWSQRLKNKSLKSQLGKDPFEKKYIGVYLNMPDYVTEQFLNWPPAKEEMNIKQIDEERARLFALYIEYQGLQLLINAIQTLRGKGVFDYTPKEAEEIVKEILQERPEIIKFDTTNKIQPRLNNLRLRFKKMHENIRYCAINKIELEPKRGYSTLQMGKLLEEVATKLLKLCNKATINQDKKEEKWTLKICLDQNESPVQYQQKSINTIIARLETGNISFAIASLSGNLDIINTYIPRHPLTAADREHHRIDNMSPSEFHEFVTSVTKLRFEQITKKKIDKLDLRNILGEWDINALLYPILKESLNPKVRELLKRSNDNIGRKFFDFKRKDLPLEQINHSPTNNEDNSETFFPPVSSKKDIPPIYQTYLIEKLNLPMPDEESDKYKIRSQKSREIRKKMVSAMLCLCREYNLSVPYAGYYMVMSMSDNCIRDFLRQMHEIFISSKCDIERFLTKKINPKIQNHSLYNASRHRYEGIGQIIPRYPSEVIHLIDSLGEITSQVQSAFTDLSTLKTIERGRFKVNYSTINNDNDRKKLKNILQDSRDCHYIKTTDDVDDDNQIFFRLHKLFAPYFKFSYRGAYSYLSINGKDLLRLCSEKDKTTRDKIIRRLVKETVKLEKTATLDSWMGEQHD